MLRLYEIEIDRGDILSDEELIYKCVTSTIYTQHVCELIILKKIKEIIIEKNIEYLQLYKFLKNILNRLHYRKEFIFKNIYEENDYIIKIIECLDNFDVFIYECNDIRKYYHILPKCLKLKDDIETLIGDYT